MYVTIVFYNMEGICSSTNCFLTWKSNFVVPTHNKTMESWQFNIGQGFIALNNIENQIFNEF